MKTVIFKQLPAGQCHWHQLRKPGNTNIPQHHACQTLK